MAESSGAAHEAGAGTAAGAAESGDDSADPDGTSDGGSDVSPDRRGAASAANREPSTFSTFDLQIQNPCGYPEVAARRLRRWLEGVLAELAPDAASATVRFVSDREVRGLNRDFRGFDKSTDVLSFPGDLPPRPEAAASTRCPEPGDDVEDPAPPDLPVDEKHLGDIVVSVPTARRQAGERGHGVERELRLLTLHGILHCLGYDHETDDGTMERVETELRRTLLAEAA